jgi:hypothetical protein
MEEYWIGKGIDIEKIWNDYENGDDYISKFRSTDIYQLQIKFNNYDIDEAIFNFEATFKSFKSAYHDFKRKVFTPEEYNQFAPLYFYEIRRGTEVWIWLGDIQPLVAFGVILWIAKGCLGAVEKYVDVKSKYFDLLNKKADLFGKITTNKV